MSLYSILKIIHFFGVGIWTAGIIGFYSLFLYKLKKRRAKIEFWARLFYLGITLPVMFLAIGTGLILAHYNPSLGQKNWFLYKMVLVFFFIVWSFHGITPLRNLKSGNLEGYTIRRSAAILFSLPLLFLCAFLLAIFKPFYSFP